MGEIIKLRNGQEVSVAEIKELGRVKEEELGKWSYRFSFEIVYQNGQTETIGEEGDEEVALKIATEIKGLRARLALAMKNNLKE